MLHMGAITPPLNLSQGLTNKYVTKTNYDHGQENVFSGLSVLIIWVHNLRHFG